MYKLTIFISLISIYYYFKSNAYIIEDHTPNLRTTHLHKPYIPVLTSTHDIKMPPTISIYVTDWYSGLEPMMLPPEKIIPVQVFYDYDGLSYSKSVYECIEYYKNDLSKINGILYKVFIFNMNEHAYCMILENVKN